MSNQKINQHLEQLAESCEEIMASTRAVRGDAFANAVALNFEMFQLGDLVGQLTGIARASRPENAEYIQVLNSAASDLMTSIICGHYASMEDDDLNDAIETAKIMLDRRKRTVAAINKDTKGGD